MQMTMHVRGSLLFGIGAAFVRGATGLMIIGLDRWLGERDMLLLFDLPTLGVYFIAAALGYPHDIINVYDVRFFSIGLAVWFVTGCAAGWLLLLSIGSKGGRISNWCG